MVGWVRKINCEKFVPHLIIFRGYSKYNPESSYIDFKNWNINLTDYGKLINWLENVKKAYADATLSNIFNNHAPIIQKKVKRKPSPWLTSQLKK